MGTAVTLSKGIPQEQVDARAWRVLLHGLSGAGKTRTASHWPKPLFLDMENGLGSVTNRIAWKTVRSWSEWLAVVDYLETQQLPIGTVVVDSLNALQRMAIDHSVGAFGKVHRSHGDIPGQSDYGKMFWDVWRSITGLLELPYHVVLIAQGTAAEYESPARPEFVGKALAQPILQAMDLIGEVKRHGGKTVLTFCPTDDAYTKDRFHLFPQPIVDPTWAKIESEVKKRTKPKQAQQPTLAIAEGVPADSAQTNPNKEND